MPGFSSIRQWWEEHLERLSPIVGARSMVAANKSDTADLTNGVCRAVYAPTAGNINIVAADDDPATGAQVIAFAAGEVKAIQARRVYASLTTVASPIVWY